MSRSDLSFLDGALTGVRSRELLSFSLLDLRLVGSFWAEVVFEMGHGVQKKTD